MPPQSKFCANQATGVCTVSVLVFSMGRTDRHESRKQVPKGNCKVILKRALFSVLGFKAILYKKPKKYILVPELRWVTFCLYEIYTVSGAYTEDDSCTTGAACTVKSVH